MRVSTTRHTRQGSVRCQGLTGEGVQLGAVCADVLALGVDLLPEGDGAVVLDGDHDEGRAAAPHPAPAGDRWLIVQQQLLKHIFSCHPRDPEVTSRQEGSH